MIQVQHEPPERQRNPIARTQRSRLLGRYPVLTPVLLLGSAVAFCMLSFFANTLFPVLMFIGASPTLLCLLIALVLGIAGLLASIISILESIDRRQGQTSMLPEIKERSYANRN